MKKAIPVIAILGFLMAAPVAHAAAPQLVPVQGVLTDTMGAPIDTTVTAVFSIYTTEVGGTALWTETQSVLVEDGLFTAYLGDVTTLDLVTFRDNGLKPRSSFVAFLENGLVCFLELFQVGSETRLLPGQSLDGLLVLEILLPVCTQQLSPRRVPVLLSSFELNAASLGDGQVTIRTWRGRSLVGFGLTALVAGRLNERSSRSRGVRDLESGRGGLSGLPSLTPRRPEGIQGSFLHPAGLLLKPRALKTTAAAACFPRLLFAVPIESEAPGIRFLGTTHRLGLCGVIFRTGLRTGRHSRTTSSRGLMGGRRCL